MTSKRRILSWDVGIKNLAYCLMEKDNSNGSFRVLKWDIVNIIDSDKIVCCGIKKNKELCGNKASFYGVIDNEKKYYCGSHKSKYKPLPDNWEETYMVECNNSKEGCDYFYPKKKERCNKKVSFRSTDGIYCRTHSKMIKNNKIKGAKIMKIKRKKATSTDPQVLGQKMYQKLDAIKGLLDVDEVLIENQPSLKNPSMKTVACFLFSYFVLRGTVDKTNITKVKFISPSNKLKVSSEQIKKILVKIDKNDRIYALTEKLLKKYLGLDYKNDKTNILLDPYVEKGKVRDNFVQLVLTYLMDKKVTLENIKTYKVFDNVKISIDNFTDIVKKIEKDDNNYDITKLLAIKYMEVIMENKTGNWINYINKFKKKDDLCDALLQGYYYLGITS